MRTEATTAAPADAALDPSGLEPATLEERRAALARLRRFGGDRLMRDMAAMFLRLLEERVSAARLAVARGDGETLARAAHSLRSSCGQFGASSAAEVCADIELRASDGAPVASLAPAVEHMVRVCDEYAAWLAHELDAAADPGRPQ